MGAAELEDLDNDHGSGVALAAEDAEEASSQLLDSYEATMDLDPPGRELPSHPACLAADAQA